MREIVCRSCGAAMGFYQVQSCPVRYPIQEITLNDDGTFAVNYTDEEEVLGDGSGQSVWCCENCGAEEDELDDLVKLEEEDEESDEEEAA